jgi:hypothetical protein
MTALVDCQDESLGSEAGPDTRRLITSEKTGTKQARLTEMSRTAAVPDRATPSLPLGYPLYLLVSRSLDDYI